VAYPPIPDRLLRLDELTRLEHGCIANDDVCFHLWERVTGGHYKEHATNQLIKNLQISMAELRVKQGRGFYKREAIQYAADALSRVVPIDLFQNWTWIPVPPSTVKGHPDYDPRLLEVLRAVQPRILDIRELVVQTVNHTSKEKNIPPETRAVDYAVDEALADPAPALAVVFDDMLAGGSHFKAMQMVLERRFPGIRTCGIFLARAIRPNLPSITLLKWPVNLGK
jgi:hypothetical protein